MKMKRIGLSCALVVMAFHCKLACVTNGKTFLSHTPENSVSTRLVSLAGLEDQAEIGLVDHKNSAQLVYTYAENYNKAGLRNYFFPYSKQDLIFGDLSNNPNPSQLDLDYRYFVHLINVNDNEVSLRLKPTQKIHHANVMYYRSFHYKGDSFFVSAQLPFVQVTNRLHPCFNAKNFNNNQEQTEDRAELMKFFAGDLNVTTATRLQEPLRKNKISDCRSESGGLSDVKLLGGWHFFDTADTRATLSVALIVPTGNKPKNRVLFEAIRGNNGHWGFESALDVTHSLWERDEYKLETALYSQLTYLFPNEQTRTLGIRHLPWGQYALLGKNGMQNQALCPAANVLSCNVDVNPGIQADSMCMGTLVTPHVNAMLGYSLLVRSEEKVSLNTPFPKNTYGVANFAYDTTTVFDLADVKDGRWLRQQDLDLAAAQTPSQVMHSVHVGLSKVVAREHVSFFANSGARASFTYTNTLPVGFACWFTGGVSF